jgi:hypothetical protein
MSRPDPHIVCAAMRSRKTGRIVCGARHFDIIMRQFTTSQSLFRRPKVSKEWKSVEQGFIDQFGQFHDRKQAYEIAARQGQIRRPEGGTPGTLYSENLY